MRWWNYVCCFVHSFDDAFRYQIKHGDRLHAASSNLSEWLNLLNFLLLMYARLLLRMQKNDSLPRNFVIRFCEFKTSTIY